jgi:hypothetical protein
MPLDIAKRLGPGIEILRRRERREHRACRPRPAFPGLSV